MLLNLAAAKLYREPLYPVLHVRRQPVGLDKLCADSFPGCCCLIRFPDVISDIGLLGPIHVLISYFQ
jgi:hypothetical protein